MTHLIFHTNEEKNQYQALAKIPWGVWQVIFDGRFNKNDLQKRYSLDVLKSEIKQTNNQNSHVSLLHRILIFYFNQYLLNNDLCDEIKRCLYENDHTMDIYNILNLITSGTVKFRLSENELQATLRLASHFRGLEIKIIKGLYQLYLEAHRKNDRRWISLLHKILAANTNHQLSLAPPLYPTQMQSLNQPPHNEESKKLKLERTIIINDKATPEIIGKIPAYITRIVLLEGASPEAVAKIPAHIRMVMLDGPLSQQILEAIPKRRLILGILGDNSAETLRYIPACFRNLALCNVEKTSLESLPKHITTISVLKDVSVEILKSMPKHIKTVQFLSSPVTEEYIESLPNHIQALVISEESRADVLKKIPSHVKWLFFSCRVSLEMAKAIPDHIQTDIFKPHLSTSEVISFLKEKATRNTKNSVANGERINSQSECSLQVEEISDNSILHMTNCQTDTSYIIVPSQEQEPLPTKTRPLLTNNTSFYSHKPSRTRPVAGIDPKYFEDGKRLQVLYYGREKQPAINYDFEINMEKLESAPQAEGQGGCSSYCETISLNNNKTQLKLIAAEGKNGLSADELCTFVFAGRKENALIPQKRQGSRIIVVVTREEYDTLQPLIYKDVDILLIERLESPSHGHYQNSSLITARRIAAFIFAHAKQLPHCIVMDDNIQCVQFSAVEEQTSESVPGSDASWQTVHLLMRQNLSDHQVSTSIQTFSYTSKNKTDKLKLGSKLFLFNMNLIRQKMPNVMEMFHLLAPAKASHYWGSDYYFQLVLHLLFGPDINGFGRINIEKASLMRSKKNTNTCKRVLTKADAHLGFDISKYINQNELSPTRYKVLCQAVDMLRTIIRDNKDNLWKKYQAYSQKNLFQEHAYANGILPMQTKSNRLNGYTHYSPSSQSFQSTQTTMPENDNNRLFSIEQIDSLTFLYPHQKKALKRALDCLTNREDARLILTTGAGKTMIQFVLAALTFQKNPNQSVFIITPKQNLVMQTYHNFIDYMDNYPQIKTAKDRLIKISSYAKDVSATTLFDNKNQDNKGIYIFCAESFYHYLNKFETSEQLPINPALVLVDEYHAINADTLKAAMFKLSCPVFGLTATPPRKDPFEKEAYSYSRKQALNDGVTAPLIIDRLTKSELEFDLAELLDRHLHPSTGEKLNRLKGIIYVSSISQAEQTRQSLPKNKDTSVFIIHSKETDYKNKLEAFRSLPYNTPAVAVAVLMCRFGYDDLGVCWGFIDRDVHELSTSQQMIGRVTRLNKEMPNKIGYILISGEVNLGRFYNLPDNEALSLADERFLQYWSKKNKTIPQSIQTDLDFNKLFSKQNINNEDDPQWEVVSENVVLTKNQLHNADKRISKTSNSFFASNIGHTRKREEEHNSCEPPTKVKVLNNRVPDKATNAKVSQLN